MNVVSYKTRLATKDFIQVEIVVEKNSQKIILIGKVSIGGGGGWVCSCTPRSFQMSLLFASNYFLACVTNFL